MNVRATGEPSLVGQVLLGRYRILRRLALGGMGAVYLARTEGARGFSKPVVIKRILPIWGDDEEIVSLFAREARILSQLQDPGIVSVMDFGQIPDGTLVMVLDYVHGYHLAQWLAYLCATQGAMPVEMAVHILLRVLSALHYAHTFVKADGKPLAVVHRDVSPSNILLDVSGHVKLVDFGIARAEGDAEEYKTEAPQLRGKFGYLAPELFTGAPPTPQTDVYSAGVVLYELLTGSNPFRGRELTDSYHKALHFNAPSVASLRADVSESLSTVLDTALAKDPAQRYASAAAFADALRPERQAPDEQCQGRLRASVQVAFAGPLPDTLGVEPLSAFDDAWRESAEDPEDQSLAVAIHEPPRPVTPGQNVAQFGRSPAPVSRSGHPVAVGSPAQAGHLPLMAAHDELTEPPTMVRRTPRSSAPPMNPRTPYQLRWVAVISMVTFGALVVAGVMRSLEHKEDHVIVIERESNHDPAARTAEPVRSASTTHTSATEHERDAAQRDAPVGPDSALLTRSFAHEQPRVQQCFALHAHSADALPDVAIEFHVGLSGVVDKAELTPGQVAHSALGSCLLEIAKSASFPRLTRAVSFRIPIQARMAKP